MQDAVFSTPELVSRILTYAMRNEISENGRSLRTLSRIFIWRLVCRNFRAIMRGYGLVTLCMNPEFYGAGGRYGVR